MTKDIVFIGVGGTSRDALETIEMINQDKVSWNILGFVDDNPALQGTEFFGYPVLGSTELLCKPPFHKVYVVIGVANDRQLLIRKHIRDKLALTPEQCPILIHPASVVSKRAKLGAGTIIMSGVFCSGNVLIGPHVIINQNSSIGHDTQIGGFVSIANNVSVAGGGSTW